MIASVLQTVVFYVFAAILIASALMVVLAKNPVRGALFLVLAFFASSVLWILLQAEFLALVLVLVYVGAVMTLFLFVIMMLNIKQATNGRQFSRYLPFLLILATVLLSLVLIALVPSHINDLHFSNGVNHAATYSNTEALGRVLYTTYLYPFELAGVLLLIAIVAAITLAFRGKRKRQSQSIAKQVAVKKSERLRLVDVKE